METTRVPLKGDIGVALGFYNKDNEKENGDHYSILGLYRHNGKESGNDYIMTGLKRFAQIWGETTVAAILPKRDAEF